MNTSAERGNAGFTHTLVRDAAQRYIGAQRTRTKCRCCFTGVNQHPPFGWTHLLTPRESGKSGTGKNIPRGRAFARDILPSRGTGLIPDEKEKTAFIDE